MSMHKLTTAEVAWAMGVGKQAARAYFEFTHTELTADEIDKLVAVVDDRLVVPKQTSSNYNPNRNKIAAAIWLCGGSLRQLALMYGTTAETILRGRDKGLGSHAPYRDKLRMIQPPIPQAKVFLMRDLCAKIDRDNKAFMNSIDVLVLAKILVNIPELSEDEGSAYDVVTPDRKLQVEEPVVESTQDDKPKDPFSPKDFDWSVVKP